MTTRDKRFRRVLAGAGALALALGGVLGAASAANAATAGYPVPDEPGTLTLHKHVADSDSTPGDPTGAPLAGVSFSVQEVGTGTTPCTAIDLTTPAGWASVSTAIDGFNTSTGALPTGFCLIGTATTVVTEEDGSTPVLENLRGLYVVKETDPGPNLIAAPAAPFLVTVPMPVPGGTTTADSWDYSVDAYPKNTLTTITPTKTVGGTTSSVPGAVVDWTISVPVPAAPFPYNNIQVTDTPVTGHTFTAFTSVALNGTPLATPDDYTVSGSTVTLTAAGLAKVNAIVSGASGVAATITVDLTTTVTGDEVGELDNDANVTLNGQTTPVDPPSTNWGTLQVLKADATTDAVLAGAEFEVYAKSTDATCAESIVAPATPVATGTTDASGVWEQVLWISNTQADATGPFTKAYCLVETVAPAGYILDPAPRDVTITTAGTAVTTYQFPNTPVEGPELPLTGSNGAMVMMIGGLGLFAVAGGVVLATRRRAASKQ